MSCCADCHVLKTRSSVGAFTFLCSRASRSVTRARSIFVATFTSRMLRLSKSSSTRRILMRISCKSTMIKTRLRLSPRRRRKNSQQSPQILVGVRRYHRRHWISIRYIQSFGHCSTRSRIRLGYSRKTTSKTSGVAWRQHLQNSRRYQR